MSNSSFDINNVLNDINKLLNDFYLSGHLNIFDAVKTIEKSKFCICYLLNNTKCNCKSDDKTKSNKKSDKKNE